MASIVRFLKLLSAVLLTASITVVGSERMFWFWSAGLSEHVFLAAFYAVPVAATLWTIDRYGVDSAWSLLLATPIYAYLTEGLITPILYTGGPFVPFFPAWFAAWHGMLGFFVMWYVVRRLLLARSWRPLLAISCGIGAFWGLWAAPQRLPENVNDEDMVADLGELVVLDPAAFAQYAMTFTAVLALSHLLLGYVWPRRFEIPRWLAWTGGALIIIGVTAWTVVAVWALPMFVVYVAVQRWGLRWHRSTVRRQDGHADLFAQMEGTVRIVDLWPLMTVAPAAALTYQLLWALDPSDTVLRVVMYGIIAAQTVIGMWVTIRALRRSRPAHVIGHGDETRSTAVCQPARS